MTEIYNRILNYKPDHSTYGGELSLFDFEGHYTMSSIARKIDYDNRFDRSCSQNYKIRERKHECKN